MYSYLLKFLQVVQQAKAIEKAAKTASKFKIVHRMPALTVQDSALAEEADNLMAELETTRSIEPPRELVPQITPSQATIPPSPSKGKGKQVAGRGEKQVVLYSESEEESETDEEEEEAAQTKKTGVRYFSTLLD